MSACNDCPHLVGFTATGARSTCCCDNKSYEMIMSERDQRQHKIELAEDTHPPRNRHERRRMAKLGR